MRWLSQGFEALVGDATQGAIVPPGGRPDKFDVIVVGSGYGGAVAACRFAEAGYAVCVLERGREYLTGEFPNDIANLPGHLRLQRDGVAGVMGSREGLFDLRLHDKVTVLVGNALGGGSQINANVALRADPALFREAHWPKALRDVDDPLDQYYTRVEDMLGVAPYPKGRRCDKVTQLEQIAEPITRHLRKHEWTTSDCAPRARAYRPPLAVTYADGPNNVGVEQRACVACGDCVTGCNYGAKNTLSMNYLPKAVQNHAKIYTGATVLAVRPRSGATTVYFCATSADWGVALARDDEQKPSSFCRPGIFSLTAEIVVLAAGSLGSTEILLRSSRHRLLRRASPRLGRGFSGNGDWLGFGFDQDTRVNAVGRGAKESDEITGPGPTIAGVLDVREGMPIADGVLLEEGIVPGPIAHLVHELLTTASILEQLGSCSMKRDGRDEDPLALSDEALDRTQVYLGIGHDDAGGEMTLEGGALRLRWPAALRQAQELRKESYLDIACRSLGGIALRNPISHPLPRATADVLTGPQVEGNALVVHPLGGCPMGDSFSEGVVDDVGAVYRGDTPDARYDSLFVWDGSILPGSLGVNPFLTIAALAERAVEHVIARRSPRSPTKEATLPRHRIPAVRIFRNQGADRIAVTLKETLRAKEGGTFPDAALHLEFRSQDLLKTLKDPRHPVSDVRGTLTIPSLELRPLKVKSGTITLLERARDCGRLRTLRGLWAWVWRRGLGEIMRYRREQSAGRRQPLDKHKLVKQVLRMAYHAAERRVFHYKLQLEGAENVKYTLCGKKPVQYNRTSNVWESLIDLHATLKRARDRRIVARGILRVDLVALAELDVPQIDTARDAPNGLMALISYATLFLRVITKLHLWDFRAPDYPSRTLRAPLPNQRPLFVEGTKLDGTEIAARRHWLRVPLREAHNTEIDIALTRLRLPRHIGPAHGTPVVLIPGFAQSTRAFVADPRPEDIARARTAWQGKKDGDPLKEDLVRHLLAKGFDVWLLDYRSSTALSSCRLQCDLDSVARFDIPRAIDYVHQKTWCEERWRPVRPAPAGLGNIMVIAHCMGSAALSMTLLSGRLQGKLRAAVLSQVPPKIIGGTYAQFHRQVAAFFRDVLRAEMLNLVADDNESLLDSIMDRIFATMPVPESELCPGERRRCVPVTDMATCKRIRGIIGPLYLHHNMIALHPYLNQYFGRGNVAAFNHAAKFFEYERVVSADGANIYLNSDNVRRYMDLPLALLHGEQNEVFRFESSVETFRLLCEVNDKQHYELLKATGYAHFDCIVGDYAYVDVYPQVSDFLLNHV